MGVVFREGSTFAIYSALCSCSRVSLGNDKQIAELKAQIIAVKENSTTRSESLETLKRVEQQLEIVLLRAGVKSGAVRLTGSDQ